jgi:hypothetical protein
MTSKRPAKYGKGQGVIEYAGALIVASMAVVAILPITAIKIQSVYTDLYSGIQTYVENQMNTLR